MRCPACGFISFDHLSRCKRCGKEFLRGEVPRRDVAITTITTPTALRSVDGLDPDLGHPDPAILPEPLAVDAPVPIQMGEAVAVAAWAAVPTPAEAPLSEVGVPVDPGSLPKAGFWVRSAAFLIDAAVVAALVSAGSLLVSAAVLIGGGLSSTPEFAQEWLEWASTTTLSALVVACYFTVFVAWRGQTPGKMLLGLRILRATGREVTLARALVRWMAQGLGVLPFGIGFLLLAFSRRKQALHDKIAGTYVIRTSA